MPKRKYFSEAEVKAGRKRSQDARRIRMAAASLCFDCGALVESRKICEKCCRKSTVRKHVARGFKTYQLGSKLSPERPDYWLRLIKFTNPILRENWSEVAPWLKKHYELYVERSDGVLYNFVQLRTDEKADEMEFASRGVQTTLEDLVIAKIDYERELAKCLKVETDEPLARLEKTAMIEKTSGFQLLRLQSS